MTAKWEHTPVRTLKDDHGKAIGRQCLHCNMIVTMAGNFSQPGTKAHERRLKAAAETE